MSTPLQIKDYQSVFWLAEAARQRHVYWTKFPVVRGGPAYRRLMLTPEGRTAYCVFIGILRIVARAKSTDGLLVANGKPINPVDVALETSIPLDEGTRAWNILRECEWLRPAAAPAAPSAGTETADSPAPTSPRPVANRSTTGPEPVDDQPKRQIDQPNRQNDRATTGRQPVENRAREEKRREENTAAASTFGANGAPAGVREGGGGGEVSERARKALQSLQVRPNTIDALMASHAPEIVLHGVYLAQETRDDKPKAGLAVHLIESGNAKASWHAKQKRLADLKAMGRGA